MWYSRCDMPLRGGLAENAAGDGDYGAETGSRVVSLLRGSLSPRASSWRKRSTPRREWVEQLLGSLRWLGQGALEVVC